MNDLLPGWTRNGETYKRGDGFVIRRENLHSWRIFNVNGVGIGRGTSPQVAMAKLQLAKPFKKLELVK